jgi:hypothetical protein
MIVSHKHKQFIHKNQLLTFDHHLVIFFFISNLHPQMILFLLSSHLVSLSLTQETQSLHTYECVCSKGVEQAE